MEGFRNSNGCTQEVDKRNVSLETELFVVKCRNSLVLLLSVPTDKFSSKPHWNQVFGLDRSVIGVIVGGDKRESVLTVPIFCRLLTYVKVFFDLSLRGVESGRTSFGEVIVYRDESKVRETEEVLSAT